MKIHVLSLLTLMVGFAPVTVLRAADANARHSRNPEPESGARIVHPVDKSIMVYVPSGYFTMGLTPEEANVIAEQLGARDYEQLWMWETFPRRKVYVGGFFIDKYEVTIGNWLLFREANPDFELEKDQISQHFEETWRHVYPVASIQWHEAQQYANWARKRLPTEAQWEKAARGDDGRFYPWGNEFCPTKGHFWKAHGLYTRVGRYPEGASPYGAMDMVGNQYEYTFEWVEPYPNNPEAERMSSYWGHQNVCLRGGSWYHGMRSCYAAKRFGFPRGTTHYHVGFRTVWEPPAGYFESDDFRAHQEAVPAREAALRKLFDRFDAQRPLPEVPPDE